MRTGALTLLLACCLPTALPARPPAGGGGIDSAAYADRVSAELDARIARETRTGLALVAKRTAPRAKVTALAWPLGPNPGLGVDWHGVSNFVDLDSRTPGRLLDYTCSDRSYDTANGYNHGGTDFFVWPFGWTIMDSGAVDVRAAAAGTLVAKADGNFDRNCSFDSPDTPNYAVIAHSDGTIARYLHLREGSVTTRPIGSSIVAGEVLGMVGSSGISTGPHLHFELRASAAPNAPVVDPFQGQCNASSSTWAAQRPYFDSRINRLATHSAPPVRASCPGTQDTPSFADQFAPGARVYVAGYYRDQRPGLATQYRVLRPDGSVFSSWSFDLADAAPGVAYYEGAWWFWPIDLPADAPNGRWRFEATFAGVLSAHEFRVGDAMPIRDPRGLTGAWYEPATSGQGFELHWLEGERLLVFFYGHHDDGTNLFLVGTRDGGIAYDEQIEVPVVITSGGRWNQFDPAAIRRDPWGTVRLRFADCDRATAELQGSDGSKQMDLVRLTRAPNLPCD